MLADLLSRHNDVDSLSDVARYVAQVIVATLAALGILFALGAAGASDVDSACREILSHGASDSPDALTCQHRP